MPGPHGPMSDSGLQKPKNTKQTLKRILSYFGKSKALIFFVVLFLIISTGASILGSYRMKPLIDKAIFPHFDAKELVNQLIILGVIFVLGSLASFLQSKIMVSLAYKTTNKLRGDLFNHMQGLPLSYFDSKTHGELMSRFTNDIDNIQMLLEQSIVQLFSSALMFVGIVGAMLVLSWQLFAITAVLLVIMMLAAAKISSKSRKHFQDQQANLGKMNGYIEETIEGMKVVKVFNHEDQCKDKFEALNTNFCDSATKANFYAGVIMPIMGSLNNIAYATTTVVGGILAIMAGFSIGSLSTFLQYSRQVSQPINQVTSQMNALFSALAGAERVFEVMDMDFETDEGTVTAVAQDGKPYWKDGDRLTAIKGEVIFHDVDFSYDGKKQILRDISLYAKPGQKIAFVGSTGAGKTTITNLINRFYDIQSGQITFDGIDIKRIKKDDLRRTQGIVLQDTHLFTGTVMDNIRYGRLGATDEECIAAAKSVSAHSFIHRLPQGYQTEITGDGDNLSQGQRQLLAIARAAVAAPPVMILDEATSSIDTRTERLIEKGMDTLMQGRTVFVIAHRLSTVRNSNAIMVLEYGEIIERGDHNALLEEKGRYYQLCTGKQKLA